MLLAVGKSMYTHSVERAQFCSLKGTRGVTSFPPTSNPCPVNLGIGHLQVLKLERQEIIQSDTWGANEASGQLKSKRMLGTQRSRLLPYRLKCASACLCY